MARSSTFDNHSCIVKVADGCMCGICQKHGLKVTNAKSKGVLVTTPLLLSASKKLYEKAEKHANSIAHLAAVAASQVSGPNVVTQIVVDHNEATI